MRIKDWNKFQHFKDRKPPWIKLYRDILDDQEWHTLDPAAAKMLVMLWLLASEADGVLPPLNKIAFRLRLTEEKANALISKLSHWLIQDDIAAISERHHGDAPETEAYSTETETESNPPAPLPDWVPTEEWDEFRQMRTRMRAPMTPKAEQLAIKQLDRLRQAGADAKAVVEQSILRGWKSFYPLKDEQTKKHARFEQQNYREGTDGFIVS